MWWCVCDLCDYIKVKGEVVRFSPQSQVFLSLLHLLRGSNGRLSLSEHSSRETDHLQVGVLCQQGKDIS